MLLQKFLFSCLASTEFQVHFFYFIIISFIRIFVKIIQTNSMFATPHKLDDMMKKLNFDPLENEMSKAELYQIERIKDQIKRNDKYLQQKDEFLQRQNQEYEENEQDEHEDAEEASNSDHSPLRNDIRQEELQEQMLNHEESQDDHIEAIQPVYHRQQVVSKPKQVAIQPKSIAEKPKPIAEKPKVIKKKQNIVQKSPNQKQIVTADQEQKENGRGYVENVYDSDLAFQQIIRSNELAVMVGQCKQKATDELEQSKKKNEKLEVFQPKKKPLHCHKQQPEEKKPEFQIRGFKDIAEIKYFGRPLPCKECTVYLSQGQSSDLCPYHGRQNKDTPPSRQIPKRFEKYL